MGKPHPFELRQRVVAHVEAGNTHRSAAARFDVSIRFVNDMVKLKRETGSLDPKRQGTPKGHGKLDPHEDWIRSKLEANGDITLQELVVLLAEERQVRVHRSGVWHFLRRLGLARKKRPARL